MFKIYQPDKKESKGKGGSVIKYFEKKEFNASIVDYFKLGEWRGLGAERMGINAAPILEGELEKWAKTLHPKTDEKIGKLSKNGLDDAYLQTVFSPPKDFSLLYFLDTTLGQKELEADWRATLDAMHKFMEQYSETRKDFTNRLEKIGLVVGEFKHETARATDKDGVEIRPDPQLHAHLLISRLGIDEEGKGRKFENRKLFFNQIQLGTFGRAFLADRLRQRGYSIEKHTEYEEKVTKRGIEKVKINSFRVVGITEEQRDFFSNRSREINELEEKYNTNSTKARDLIANTNKKAKKEFEREELVELWKEDANKIGLTNEFLQSQKNLGNESILNNLKTDEELVSSVMTKDIMSHKDIMSRLYEYQQYTGIKADDLFKRLVKEKKLFKDGYNYTTKINFSKKDAKRKSLNSKIKNDPGKVRAVAFSKDYGFDNLINGEITNLILQQLNSDKKEFNVLLDKEDKQIEREEKERIRVYSNLPQVARSPMDNQKNKETINTSFSIAKSIEGVESQISVMHNKLLDPNVSEESKIRIRYKMESMAQKLLLLRKKKLNATPLN